MYEVEHLIAVQNILGEGPVWNAQEQKLYWVDIQDKAFFRYDPATNQHERFDLERVIGALTPNKDGRIIMATEAGLEVWDFESKQMTLLENNVAVNPVGRFNDGAVDRKGRFWAGTMSPNPVNHLFRLDLDGDVTIVEDSILTSNGIGWSPDNRTMYYSDSGPGIVYAYDFDLSAGEISNRRVFYEAKEGEGKADGLTVDSEGCIWAAFWDGWKVVRFAPDGSILTTIDMPVQRPTSCNFGGANLDEVYITSASTGLTDKEKAKQPYAGDVFRIKVDVKGIAEPIAQITLNV